jgi:aryl-alcohol dehydrogenase-like predicted oxidoreductase
LVIKIPPIDVEQDYTAIDALKEVAQNHEATPVQVAIAWILTNKNFDPDNL